MIERDGVTWYFCENHEGKDYKCLCVRHKIEDCQRKKNPKFRREKTDKSKQAEPLDNKQNVKIILQKGLKIALLTMGMITEDQVDFILKETQEHLPKDF